MLNNSVMFTEFIRIFTRAHILSKEFILNSLLNISGTPRMFFFNFFILSAETLLQLMNL